ncbi:hypothetical protein EYF80_047831 [Liparis tanakae]|uniref:Uncharacterized protein n=1 Tax=Liparis tanakae TaxID=230148 RepID=A0A4Z2FL79_9TELE|nr:hypothetical protein EYF80_047831 [Liparis tanakae]
MGTRDLSVWGGVASMDSEDEEKKKTSTDINLWVFPPSKETRVICLLNSCLSPRDQTRMEQ